MVVLEIAHGTSRRVAVRGLGKLLRHHRLLGRGPDWSAIRGDNPEFGDQRAGWRLSGRRIRYPDDRPLLRRPAHGGGPERAMAWALRCRDRARRLRCGRAGVRADSRWADATADSLCAGARRLDLA